eukprot:3703487-Rhodomonas_salina.1
MAAVSLGCWLPSLSALRHISLSQSGGCAGNRARCCDHADWKEVGRADTRRRVSCLDVSSMVSSSLVTVSQPRAHDRANSRAHIRLHCPMSRSARRYHKYTGNWTVQVCIRTATATIPQVSLTPPPPRARPASRSH